MRMLIDRRPLRESPAFRRLWMTTGLSNIGTQMTVFAVTLQVYRLTRSPLAVGGVGLAAAVPAVTVGLLAGSVVDSADRRRLVLVCSSIQMALSGALAAQAFADFDRVWLLYVLVAANSTSGAINGPARRTFMPRLLPPALVPAGAALNMLTFHGSVIAGPALAGVVAGTLGLRACYLVDALSYTAALYGVARLPAMRPEGGPARPGLRAVGDGLRFIRRSKVLTGAFLSDLNATVLGMPIALFPAVNAERYGGSAHTLGALVAAPAVGGLVSAMLSGPVGQVRRPGRAQLLGNVIWGAALAGFGLAGPLWLAVTFLGVAGAADATSVVFRTAMVQVATPDRYRGRVAATEYVVGACCPQLGNFRGGALGSLTSVDVSAVTGGLSVIAGAAVLRLALPAFAHYSPDLAPAAPPEGRPAPEAMSTGGGTGSDADRTGESAADPAGHG
jgi:MFS family permease